MSQSLYGLCFRRAACLRPSGECQFIGRLSDDEYFAGEVIVTLIILIIKNLLDFMISCYSIQALEEELLSVKSHHRQDTLLLEWLYLHAHVTMYVLIDCFPSVQSTREPVAHRTSVSRTWYRDWKR